MRPPVPSTRTLFATIFFLAAISAIAQQDVRPPALSGYVTRFVSSTNFELDRRQVTLKTETPSCGIDGVPSPADYSAISPGDHLEVWGSVDKRSGAILADRVCDRGWRKQKLDGFAVVDAVVRDGSGKVTAIRGDGRLLAITPKTVIHEDPPLRPLAQAAANDWMSYKAVRQTDGNIVAEELAVGPNTVSDREQRLRDHPLLDFTPPDVPAVRGGTVRFAHLEGKHPLPPDAVLAERLTRVGNSVVPAYQKALAADDPTRIAFRFYPMGKSKLQGCLSVPGGMVFVPTAVTDRLPQDEQLAAVLATCVADILEKQALLALPKSEATTAAEWGSLAVGAFVPGVSLVGLGVDGYAAHLQKLRVEQSARVSLDYLEAAGYDPAHAPETWQILSDKHGQPKPSAPLCTTSQYLYEVLAERTRGLPRAKAAGQD